ncbi:hypothetical protein RJ639_027478, partial [Escallonia herrerae]
MESSSSRYHKHKSTTKRERFVTKRLGPAILGKSCPICLRLAEDRGAAVIAVCMHAYCVPCIRRWSGLKRNCPLCNAEFDSWFFKISLRYRTFCTERLPALDEGKMVNIGDSRGRRREPLTEQRMIRRSREEEDSVSLRTGPVPRRRSFGRLGPLSADDIAESFKVAIYEHRLQAVPCSSKNCLEQNASRNGVKEMILRKIEPWTRRELQAILGDPDPSIIVHVATSLFISSLEKRSGEPGKDDNYLEPLRHFLHEWTTMFWHEL